jgi:hypothetical protein
LARSQNRLLLDGPFPRTGLQRGVSDGPQLRALAMGRIAATGARIVRIPVNWRDTVSADPAAGFQAGDPASPDYHFELIDGAVESAVAAGLQPLLVVSHAPAFAEAGRRWPFAYLGSWTPDPTALERYAAALARRYDGTFPDPAAPGRALPRATLFQAWNEPNLARYLEPQWIATNARWSAFSPLTYRQLLNGFYAGIKSVSPTDTVITAGIAPDGDPDGVGRMAPIRFLRALLCLAPSGNGGLRRERCPEPAHFDVLAFHPLSVASPDQAAASSLDVAISDAGKVTGLLRAAESEHTVLPAGPKAVWVTELNWESAPQARGGVAPAEQARWISRALHRLWVAGVSLAAWQFLVDPYPAAQASTPDGSLFEYKRPAGLYAAGPGGNPQLAIAKPFLTGFSFPFDPLRIGVRRVRLWAIVQRPGELVAVERRRGARWVIVGHLAANAAAVVNGVLRMRGRAQLRLVAGGAVSATAGVGRRRGVSPA